MYVKVTSSSVSGGVHRLLVWIPGYAPGRELDTSNRTLRLVVLLCIFIVLPALVSELCDRKQAFIHPVSFV